MTEMNARQRAFHKAKINSQLRYCEYLLENPCADCGEDDIVVLEPDHVRGEKKWNVSRMIKAGYPWASVLLELAKCEIVCRNCHQRREHHRQGNFRLAFLESLDSLVE